MIDAAFTLCRAVAYTDKELLSSVKEIWHTQAAAAAASAYGATRSGGSFVEVQEFSRVPTSKFQHLVNLGRVEFH